MESGHFEPPPGNLSGPRRPGQIGLSCCQALAKPKLQLLLARAELYFQFLPPTPGKFISCPATILEEPGWYLGVAGINCQAQAKPQLHLSLH